MRADVSLKGLNLESPTKEPLMSRLDKGSVKFDNRSKRAYQGSIYMKERTPDYSNNDKLQKGYK